MNVESINDISQSTTYCLRNVKMNANYNLKITSVNNTLSLIEIH